jgi:hypothetical protein
MKMGEQKHKQLSEKIIPSEGANTMAKNIDSPDGAPEQNEGTLLDLNRLRLPQNFGTIIGGKKGLTTVPVGRPDAQAFIQVHQGEDFEMSTAVLVVKEERETYLVEKHLWEELGSEIVLKHLYTTITRQGNLCIWPVSLPRTDGKIDSWSLSGHKIAIRAKGTWLRIISNQQVAAYEYIEPSERFPDPQWPAHSFLELLELAFGQRVIRDLSHPVVKKLRGQEGGGI